MGKRVRSGSHLLDPAHAHVNEKITATGWLRAWTSVVTLSGSCAFFLKHEWGDWGGLENLCSVGAKASVPEAALKSAHSLSLGWSLLFNAYIGNGNWAVFACASVVGSPCPNCVYGTSSLRRWQKNNYIKILQVHSLTTTVFSFSFSCPPVLIL